MNRFESVTKPLMWFITLLLVALVTGCGGGGGKDPILGTDGAVNVGIAPTVTVVSPANNATNVAINRKITATFSKAMDSATLNSPATNFTVACPAGTAVVGTVAYLASSRIATFSPAANLPINTTCTATIATGAKDTTGLALANAFVWKFTTGSTADTTRPTVTLTVPVAGATGVAPNTKVSATFSKDMDPATILGSSFTLVNTTLGGTAVAGAVTYSSVGRVAIFTPTTPATLPTNTLFTATVTTVAADLAGNTLAANKVWTFKTGTTSDTTAPTVTLVNPANLATLVCIDKTINATFSKSMDPLTITTDTITLKVTSTGALVNGVVAYDEPSKIASFNPVANLAGTTQYTATIKGGASGVKDLAGNALAVDKVWTFTTGTNTCQTPVDLGSSSTYGTFGGTAGMTNQGILTIINGDIGTIATATSSITGFHDTEGDVFTETTLNIGDVNGTIRTCTISTTGPNHTVVNASYCSLAIQARLDAQTAYGFLAAMPSDGVLAGNLAGTTINPGVYTNSSSVEILGGDLTLDALGDANAVFVFQIGSTLTVGGPGNAHPQSIILAGGAQAKNVFWQVGSAATINAGGGGTMVGTIISQAGTTFSTAGNVALVTLNGRALSLGASVTMVNTVINVPAP